MKARQFVLELPDILYRELELIPETGIYASKNEFLIEAIKTLLTARRDLRIALACTMYEKGEATLSGASEIADVDIETMKQMLARHGIRRASEANAEEVKRMSEASIRFSNRV